LKALFGLKSWDKKEKYICVSHFENQEEQLDKSELILKAMVIIESIGGRISEIEVSEDLYTEMDSQRTFIDQEYRKGHGLTPLDFQSFCRKKQMRKELQKICDGMLFNIKIKKIRNKKNEAKK